MDAITEYPAYDGLGLADLVRRREVTAAELVDAAVERIERLNPTLNAVIEPTYDQARDAAGSPPAGPFQGVPFLLKDLMAAQAGVPMRAGSRFLRSFVADRDTELVRRYRAAGVSILGRTNTPEFGLLPTTEPELFGPTHNPWDPFRTPGGSSGGSAAAVAARLVPVAHGNDGGGSIRIPAACCGVFGLKPTRGRMPVDPQMSDTWQGLAIDHVLTRSVRDSAAMLDATAGAMAGALYCAPTPSRPFLEEIGADPGRLRIAFTTEPWMGTRVTPACGDALAAAVALCEELGHEVCEASPPVDGRALTQALLVLIAGEVWSEIAEAEARTGRKASSDDFEASTWAFYLLGRHMSAGAFVRALQTLHATGPGLVPFFENYDVLLTPTLATPPPPLGALTPSPMETLALELLGALRAGRVLKAVMDPDLAAEYVFDFMPYTPLANASGYPAMSVPLSWTADNLPIGIHAMAGFGDEATLFRLAAQFEEAAPWADRVPSIAQGLGGA